MIQRASTRSVLQRLGLSGAAWAAAVDAQMGVGVGFGENDLVAPASVMKIQIGLAVAAMVATGEIDGSEQRRLESARRVPGPVGVSLMRDDVSMSVRDLIWAMLTISDNVATDELIAIAGLSRINAATRALGLSDTVIVSDLQGQLDQIADAAGFPGYRALAAHSGASPSASQIERAIVSSAALDPRQGTRTTATETVELLKAIWTDRAGPPEACAEIRDAMARQLVRVRIASGFDARTKVAAKSGGLLGVVRNEAGVVTLPDGQAYAVAVFTRCPHETRVQPAEVDAAIGVIARDLIDELRRTV